PGEIGDVGLPVERDEVVLAHGVEGDLPDHDDLLVMLVTKGDLEHLAGIGVQAFEHLGVEASHAFGCLQETLPPGVLAQCLDYLPHGLLDTGCVYRHPPRLPPATTPGPGCDVIEMSDNHLTDVKVMRMVTAS